MKMHRIIQKFQVHLSFYLTHIHTCARSLLHTHIHTDYTNTHIQYVYLTHTHVHIHT